MRKSCQPAFLPNFRASIFFFTANLFLYIIQIISPCPDLAPQGTPVDFPRGEALL